LRPREEPEGFCSGEGREGEAVAPIAESIDLPADEPTSEDESDDSKDRAVFRGLETAVGTATRALTERPLGSEELVEDEMDESDEEEEV
jgi:hypothetical protein